MPVLVDQITDLVCNLGEVPLAFFGHSMGGLIAFDVAQNLASRGVRGPSWLIISATRSPDRAVQAAARLRQRSDEELIESLRRFDGTPAEILASREILARSLPIIRADYDLVASRSPPPYPPLACDLLTVAGQDDPTVPPHLMEGWGHFTRARHARVVCAGGHFYLHQEPDQLFAAIRKLLARRALDEHSSC
jgi:surfactin synthase thioesterase subunit